jgi:hypothetical protein
MSQAPGRSTALDALHRRVDVDVDVPIQVQRDAATEGHVAVAQRHRAPAVLERRPDLLEVHVRRLGEPRVPEHRRHVLGREHILDVQHVVEVVPVRPERDLVDLGRERPSPRRDVPVEPIDLLDVVEHRDVVGIGEARVELPVADLEVVVDRHRDALALLRGGDRRRLLGRGHRPPRHQRPDHRHLTRGASR